MLMGVTFRALHGPGCRPRAGPSRAGLHDILAGWAGCGPEGCGPGPGSVNHIAAGCGPGLGVIFTGPGRARA